MSFSSFDQPPMILVLVFADILRDISQHQEVYLRQEDGAQKKKALIQIQRGLIKSQEIGDEKLALAGLISEFIENRTRQLEQDLENLGELCDS